MSKIIKHNYFYITEMNFSPNLVNLHLLYKPIISNDAFILYLEMMNESKINCFNKENKRSLFDIYKKLNFDYTKFNKNRKILEAVNLLTTYLDETNENEVKYYFILNHPLDYNNFISNYRFKKILSLKLTSHEYDELEFIFKDQKISSFAKNISADISEIFTDEISFNYDFNFEELYSRISQITSMNILFSEETKNILNSFYKNYSLSINDLETCTLHSIEKKDNEFIVDEILLNNELTIFVNKSNNVNFYEIIKINRTNNIFENKMDKNELDKIFLDYKNIRSEQYLASIQKQQLNENEITMLKTLRRDFYLPDDIINLILDFSLRKTYGKMNILYMKKVAKTISILNLENLKDVYNHLLNASTKHNKNYQNKNIDINDEYNDLNIVNLVI